MLNLFCNTNNFLFVEAQCTFWGNISSVDKFFISQFSSNKFVLSLTGLIWWLLHISTLKYWSFPQFVRSYTSIFVAYNSLIFDTIRHGELSLGNLSIVISQFLCKTWRYVFDCKTPNWYDFGYNINNAYILNQNNRYPKDLHQSDLIHLTWLYGSFMVSQLWDWLFWHNWL